VEVPRLEREELSGAEEIEEFHGIGDTAQALGGEEQSCMAAYMDRSDHGVCALVVDFLFILDNSSR
jgi:hypothetical protein